jgi:hypothetical protein
MYWVEEQTLRYLLTSGRTQRSNGTKSERFIANSSITEFQKPIQKFQIKRLRASHDAFKLAGYEDHTYLALNI